jgi:hypothetical protein
MPQPDSDPHVDAFRYDFLLYLAERLGISYPAALQYLGDWLVEFNHDDSTVALAPSPVSERGLK